MDAPTLILVAVGLAMDALAVAVGIGLCTKERALRAAVRVGFHFGVFQAGMTVLGWLAGSGVAGWVDDASHWIAAALLWLVGGHMLLEALLRKPPPCPASTDPARPAPAPACPPRDMSRGWALLGLSVATSIDAFGVGMGLAFLGAARLWFAAGVIGAVAAVLPGAGLVAARHVAARTGGRLARGAEVAGALVLIGIGVRTAFFSV
ncbi:MAG: manganese efflux pump MntP [Planctomycetota bacterium]